VIAALGGNAGIATAFAAQVLGVRAEIYVPSVISPAKRERLAVLGAHVVIAGEVYADALDACEVREIEAQAGTPDTVLVSVGGGGLIAGIAADSLGARRSSTSRRPNGCGRRRDPQSAALHVAGVEARRRAGRRVAAGGAAMRRGAPARR